MDIAKVKFIIKKKISEIKNQEVLIENYFYLTLAQLFNTLYYFLIFPFSIKLFGEQDFGLFIYSTTIISFFTLFISFGIDMPALRILTQNIKNKKIKSDLLSDVLSTKILLSFLSLCGLMVVSLLNPELRGLLFINSLQAFSSIFLLSWYYQGMQKMKWFVIPQIAIRISSILLLLVFIKNKDDLLLYSLIISGSVFLVSILTFWNIVFKEGLSVRIVKLDRIFKFIKKAYHFFINSSISVVRSQSTNVFVGSYVGMTEVGYFDLASKIILLPQSIVSNINNALFPKLLVSNGIDRILLKKIFLLETILGFFLVSLVVFFGDNVISIFLKENVPIVHNLAILLSITILSYLLVGSAVNFVFIPRDRYDIISKNQIIAFITFFLSSFIGMYFLKSVYVIAFSVALSAIIEILYCFAMVVKLRI